MSVLPDCAKFPVKSGEAILEAASRYGFSHTVGCRRGGCGACRVDIVSGEVIYIKTVSQSVLPDNERDRGVCLSCRAVPISDLVVRLKPYDRLKRGPFTSGLVERDLVNAARNAVAGNDLGEAGAKGPLQSNEFRD